MKKNIFTLFVLLAVTISHGFAQLGIQLESGMAFTQYNNVQAPNGEEQSSSRFSLRDDFTNVQTPVYLRAELSYLIADKHTVEVTAAPLVVESEGLTRLNIRFENGTFSDANTVGRYQFNTYRLSYRYRFIDNEKFQLNAGATLLVRDAEISLRSGDNFENNTDLGFVPLISLDTRYIFNEELSLRLKGDALVGPVGRAEDFFLGLVYTPADRVDIHAGYRLIEGGADVEQVYNFAFFHFAAIGVKFKI